MIEIAPRFVRAPSDSGFLRTLSRLDWSLAGAALILSLAGVAAIYSATSPTGQGHAYMARQLSALAVGIAAMSFLVVLPYPVFRTYAKEIYIAAVVLLVAVLIFGTRLRGSKSWFNLGVIFFQPVELTRLALAVAVAAYVDVFYRELRQWRHLAAAFLLLGVHMGLILMQPDFSSTLNMGPMVLAVLYAAGAPVGVLVSVLAVGALALGIPLASTYFHLMGSRLSDAGALGWLKRAFQGGEEFYMLWGGVCLFLCFLWWFLRRWRVPIHGFYLACSLAVVAAGVSGSFVVKKGLKEYQRKRLIAFVDPRVDPLGAGYNILQSEIAIGSGRVFGKGYLSGSQSQLGFLPERHTDFIFSLVAEEGGFFWTVTVLTLYFWIVWRAFDIAAQARDRFGRFLAVALGALFAFSGLFNIGMTMGLMPVTGLPFPFMSYGGSSLVGAFLGVGILLSIHLRRYVL
ncbi:MAG: rod shape-determining protein RodA [Elusimicrobiota bacterium]